MRILILLFFSVIGNFLLAQPALNPLIFPFFENFESFPSTVYGGPHSCVNCSNQVHWKFEASRSTGRLRFQLGYSNSGGSAAASLDQTGSFSTGFSSNALVTTFNLLNEDTGSSHQIVLDFDHLDHGSTGGLFETVSIRGDSAASWIKVYDLRSNGVSGQWVSMKAINCSAILSANGQNFSSSFQVRFNQFDRYAITSASGDGGRSIDNISLRRVSCPTFTHLYFEGLDTNAFRVWVPDSSSNFVFEYGVCGFTPGTGTIGYGNNGSALLNNSFAGNCLEFYVRSVCGVGDSSIWNGPFPYETSCNLLTAPNFEDFESSVVPALPDCYTGVKANSLDAVKTYSSQGYSGGKCGAVRSTLGSAYYDSFLASPGFVDLDSSKHLSFYLWNRSQASSPLYIGTLLSPSDTASFIPIDTIDATVAGGRIWKKHDIDLSQLSSNHNYFAFRYKYHGVTSHTGYLIDNIHYENRPNCFPVIDHSVEMLARFDTSVLLSWENGLEGGGITRVIYGQPGFNPLNGSIGIEEVPKGVTTYNLNNLLPNTAYEYYLQDSCGVDSISRMIGPFSFYTACSQVPVSLPFFEDFENHFGVYNTDSVYYCGLGYNWSFEEYNNGELKFQYDTISLPFDYFSGIRSAKLGSNSFSDSTLLVLTANLSQQVNSGKGVVLSYYFANHLASQRPAKVWARGSVTDPWLEVLDWQNNSNGVQWKKDSIFLDTLLASHNQTFSTTTQIAWAHKGGVYGGSRGLALDNVLIKEVSCLQPSITDYEEKNGNKVVLKWKHFGPQAEYQLWHRNTGQTDVPGSSSGVLWPIVTADSLVVDTLEPNRCYEWFIRRICAPGDSSAWSGPYEFCTSCGTLKAPYDERFDQLTPGLTGNLGNCWRTYSTRENHSNPFIFKVGQFSTPTASTGPSQDAGTGYGKYVYLNSKGGYGQDTAYFELQPFIDLSSVSNPTLDFSYHMYGNAVLDLKVDIDTGTGWFTIWTISGPLMSSATTPWVDKRITLTSFGDSARVRFWSRRTFSSNSMACDVAIDNIVINTPTNCTAPVNISQIGGSSNTSQLTWDDNGAMAYQLSFGPNLQNPDAGQFHLASSDTTVLSSLTAGTQYRVFVRSICAAGDTSLWSYPILIGTLCPPGVAPYFENFDQASIDQLPNCWLQSEPSSFVVSLVDSTDRGEVIPSAPHAVELNEGAYPVALITPGFSDLGSGLNKVMMKVAYEGNNVGGGSDTLYFGTMSNPYDFSTFSLYKKIFLPRISPSQFQSYTVLLEDTQRIGNNTHMAFLYDPTYSSSYEYYIDDFSYEQSIACSGEPTNIAVDEFCEWVNLSWTSATDTSILEYGPVGFSRGTGNVLQMAKSPLVLPSGTQGLNPGTAYEFYLADSCFEGRSLYKGPIPFALDRNRGATANIQILKDSLTATEHFYTFKAVNHSAADVIHWNFGNGTTGWGEQITARYNGASNTYRVALEVINNCGVDTTSILINASIGLEEQQLQSIGVFPNPFHEELILELPEQISGKLDVKILSLDGKRLLFRNYFIEEGSKAIKLQLNALASGMYLIEINHGGNRVYHRIVKD